MAQDRFPEDPLITALTKAARNRPPTDLVVLRGFIGKSPLSKHVRLYVSSDLGSYLDIPEEQARHAEPLEKTVSPLGGSVLWVEADAVVKRTTELAAEFLTGELASEYSSDEEEEGVPGPPDVSTSSCKPKP